MVILNLTLHPPKKKSPTNSILAHNKLSLQTAYNITYKYDIICASETYLNLSVHSSKLSIPGYDVIRADHPNDQKRCGVCLYFKENLILRRLDVFHIAQCLLCEVTIENKKGYRSPSQTANEFHDFQYNFEKLQNQVKQIC